MSAPTKAIQLLNHPLRVTVPQTWALSELAGIPFLQGPVPSGGGIEGKAQLQISRIVLPSRAVTGMLADVERERANPPKDVSRIDVKPLGGGTLVDRTTTAVRESDGASREVVGRTVELYVTEGDLPVLYRLRFLESPRVEYEVDRALFDRIVGSLEYTR